MKKRHQLWSLIAVATMLVGCSYGATSTSKSSNEEEEALSASLTVYTPYEESWLQDQLSAFKKEHPKWDLTFQTKEVSQEDMINQVASSESTVDVYMYTNNQLPELLNQQLVAEIGGDTLKDIKKSNQSVMVNSVSYDGSVYGVPYESDAWFMYYDTDDFTTKDIKNLDTMLNSKKIAMPLSDSMFLETFYLANGCSAYGIDGTDIYGSIDFAGEKAYEVTNYLVDLVGNKNFVNATSQEDAIAKLQNGSVSAIFAQSSAYEQIQQVLGEDHFGVAVLPTYTVNGKTVQMKAFVTSDAVGVNPKSENLQVSLALAKYLGGEDVQFSLYETYSIVPIYVDEEKEDEEDIRIRALRNTLDKASVMKPFALDQTNYSIALTTMGSELLDGVVTKENANEKTDAMANAMVVSAQ